jgi:phosphatidylserine/phosphatidylglycerophosphate/cardiolipin synthase-like enzyme
MFCVCSDRDVGKVRTEISVMRSPQQVARHAWRAPGFAPRIIGSRTVYVAVAIIACVLAIVAASTALRQRDDGFAPIAGEAVIHYAPAENLERIDVALIDQARTSIDMAAYVLTDWAIIQALTRAADRGVAVAAMPLRYRPSPASRAQPVCHSPRSLCSKRNDARLITELVMEKRSFPR